MARHTLLAGALVRRPRGAAATLTRHTRYDSISEYAASGARYVMLQAKEDGIVKMLQK